MAFTNAISWFEIPSIDLARAQKFYETIFDIELIVMDLGDQIRMRMFPLTDMMGVGGAVVDSGAFTNPLPRMVH